MKTHLSICFWARKKRGVTVLQMNSPVTIYCRLSVRGRVNPVELSTGLDTTYGNWAAANGMGYVKGKTEADRHINTQLTKLRNELTDIHVDLERQGKPVTARAILRVYQKGDSVLSMAELFEQFLAEREQLVGVDICASSHSSNKQRYNRLKEFLAVHKLNDLRPEEFGHNMADKLLYWLLREKNFKRSTANKTVGVLFQVLRWGVRREHLDRNPLELYQYKHVAPGEIKYLTVGEVQHLSEVDLPAYLDKVRDCFTFQCWTGLAYADLMALDVRAQADYHRDQSGTLRRVLRVTRAKSTLFKGYECVIPLLPEAERILAKYGDELPTCSNQVYNRYLKEVGETCGFAADKMTSHVGRKTAGVLMLNAGIRMEVVSKFLGHSSVRMTEKAYAKILDRTVIDAFASAFGGQYQLAPAAPAVRPIQLASPQPEAPKALALRPARRITQPMLELPVAPEVPNPIWKRPPPVTALGGQKGGAQL